MSSELTDDTPARLVASATRQFAARGFAGTSIASVAQDLGLTKQALLHHFGTKDRLYVAVLDGVFARVMSVQDDAGDAAKAFDRLFDHMIADRDDAALIAREVLDHEMRDETGRQWFLIPLLNRLTALARSARPELNDSEALAEVHAHLGAMVSYAASHPTLRDVYGKKTMRRLDKAMAKTLRKQAKRRFLGKKTARKA